MTERIEVIKRHISRKSLPVGDTLMTMPAAFSTRLAVDSYGVVVDGEFDGTESRVIGISISGDVITDRTPASIPLKTIIHVAFSAMVYGFNAGPMKRPRVYTVNELRHVADIYWHAYVTHGPTRMIVQRTWNLPEKTAARWIKAAQAKYDFPLKGTFYPLQVNNA